MKTAFSVGIFIFFIFFLFAFSFYMGSYLILNKFANSVKISTKNTRFIIQTVELEESSDFMQPPLDLSVYTGGDMIAIFFAVCFGVFSIGFTLPNFKAIIDGKAAGY